MLLRVSCIFVADGVKTELQGEDSLEVEPLVCRVEERLESLRSLPIFGLEKGKNHHPTKVGLDPQKRHTVKV